MNISLTDLIAFISGVALLVLNLRVNYAMASLKAEFEKDMAALQTTIEELRTERAEGQLQLLASLKVQFMDRHESELLHEQAARRIDRLEDWKEQVDKVMKTS